jgi:predicted GIY-YIG superfamily endonuclease
MDISFNILDCFDDKIDNLDITKYYIYVLRLVDDRYYVGRTGNILRRIEEHFTGVGSIYTMKYNPIKVIEVTEELSNQDERNKTLEVMSKYGWKKVRGACWCSLEINKPKERYDVYNKNNKCCGIIFTDIDFEITQLYNYENKDIQDIGDMLKKSPCWIAKRLEDLKIVKRKQLARGYIKYIESDSYKLKCKKMNYNKRENQSDKIDCISKTELTKEHLLNIKKIIREKILTGK